MNLTIQPVTTRSCARSAFGACAVRCWSGSRNFQRLFFLYGSKVWISAFTQYHLLQIFWIPVMSWPGLACGLSQSRRRYVLPLQRNRVPPEPRLEDAAGAPGGGHSPSTRRRFANDVPRSGGALGREGLHFGCERSEVVVNSHLKSRAKRKAKQRAAAWSEV